MSLGASLMVVGIVGLAIVLWLMLTSRDGDTWPR
jgi:hypothetical protein